MHIFEDAFGFRFPYLKTCGAGKVSLYFASFRSKVPNLVWHAKKTLVSPTVGIFFVAVRYGQGTAGIDRAKEQLLKGSWLEKPGICSSGFS